MDIGDYLKAELAQYPLHRLKVRADIALQQLVNDHIIAIGNAYYIRDQDLQRCGVECEWRVTEHGEVKKVQIDDYASCDS